MLLSEIRTINVLENIKKYNIDVSQYEDIASIRKAIRKEYRRIYNLNNKLYFKNYCKEYYKNNKDTKWIGQKKQPPEYFKEYYRKKKLNKMETIYEEITKGDSMPSIRANQ